MSFPAARSLSLILLLCLAGCVSPPVLDPPSTDIPPDIDLSGQWVLRDASQRSEPGRASDALIIPKDRRRPARSRSKSAPGSSARLFLESGKSLRITQSESALFISFDRSVVEEYRFGVRRDVSIGPVIAQRATGWEQGTLVVRTLDEDGALLTETWRLLDDGRVLERRIALWHKEKELLAGRQLFDRQT